MTQYRERLHPAPSMFFCIALVIPASILVFLPITAVPGFLVGIAVGAVLYSGVIALFVATAPVIEITADTLRVGRATIPRAFLGEIRGYDGDAATWQRGPALDARAWLCIRGWVKPVVKIAITDPIDPVPYWLVSTRHPETMIHALGDSTSAGQPNTLHAPIRQGEEE